MPSWPVSPLCVDLGLGLDALRSRTRAASASTTSGDVDPRATTAYGGNISCSSVSDIKPSMIGHEQQQFVNNALGSGWLKHPPFEYTTFNNIRAKHTLSMLESGAFIECFNKPLCKVKTAAQSRLSNVFLKLFEHRWG